GITVFAPVRTTRQGGTQGDDSSLAGCDARSGAERGLSPAELLSFVSVVVAGRHQGRLPRPRPYPRRIRARGLLALLLDEAAERGVPEELCEALSPPRLHPLQRLPARPLPVPVLRHPRGPDLRPRHSAPLRRRDDMGKRRRRLRPLQPEERRPAAAPGEDVATPDPGAADR